MFLPVSFEHLPEHQSKVFDFHSELSGRLFAVAREVLLILEDFPLEIPAPRLAQFQTASDEQLKHLRLGEPEE